MKNRRKAQVEFLPFATLAIDSRYQRSVVQARINKLVAEWNIADVGILTVSIRDGKFWIIDGQHRYLAALKKGFGETKVPCHVYRNLTVEQEAELFDRLNDQRAPTPYDRFKAGLVYGDRVAVGVDRVVRSHGFRVANHSGKGRIACVSALTTLYKRDPVVLDQVLEVISGAWAETTEATESSIVSGLGKVVSRYNGELDKSALVKKLSKTGSPAQLLGNAKSMRALTGNSSSISDTVAQMVVEIYNKGRRTKVLDPL